MGVLAPEIDLGRTGEHVHPLLSGSFDADRLVLLSDRERSPEGQHLPVVEVGEQFGPGAGRAEVTEWSTAGPHDRVTVVGAEQLEHRYPESGADALQ